MSSIRCDIYDRDEWDIWFAAAPYGAASKPAKTLKTWAAEEGADVVCNLCLFNMSGSGSDQYGVIKGRTLQYLKAKGVDCGYGGTAEKLTVSPGNIVSGVKVAVKNSMVQALDKTTRRSRNMIAERDRQDHCRAVLRRLHGGRGSTLCSRTVHDRPAACAGRGRLYGHVSRQ